MQLIELGWSARRLERHDRQLLDALPSLAEVMGDEDKWASLGVRPSLGIASEQSELALEMPSPNRNRHAAAADDDPEGAVAVPKAQEARSAPMPATAGEELWERKGWNRIDGGWRGLF